jgi:hypothetical protein
MFSLVADVPLRLNESVAVPPSEELSYAPPMTWLKPVDCLLKEGERERVVRFLEELAELTVTERTRLSSGESPLRHDRRRRASRSRKSAGSGASNCSARPSLG